MKQEITDEQIERARQLRREGQTFAAIAVAIGYDGEVSNIRHHCLDIAIPGERAVRVDKPMKVRRDGSTIIMFTPEQDAQLIDFVANRDPATNLNQLAKSMGRKRHSLSARLSILRRRGQL